MYILFYMLLAAPLGTIRFAAWTYPVSWSKIIAQACKMKLWDASVTGVGQIGYGKTYPDSLATGSFARQHQARFLFHPETTSPQMHPSKITCRFVRTCCTQASSVGASWADVASSAMAVVVSSVG